MKPTKEANEIKRRVARMLDRLAFSPSNTGVSLSRSIKTHN